MRQHEGVRAYARGHRPITAQTLSAAQAASAWRGLPDGKGKSHVLRAIDDLDCEEHGLSEKARDLLRILVKHQKPDSFRTVSQVGEPGPLDGLELVSTLKNDYLAYLLGCSTRHISRLIAQLICSGFLVMRDSGNRQRWARGDYGAADEIYGFDLRPLISRYVELVAAKEAQHAQFLEGRRRRRVLSAYLNTVRGLMANVLDEEMEQLAHSCVRTIQSTRHSKDLDILAMSMSFCEQAVEKLSASITCSAFSVTQESSVHDMGAEQITPTNEAERPKQYKEAWRGGVRDPSPAPGFAASSSDWIEAEIEDLAPAVLTDVHVQALVALPIDEIDDQLTLPDVLDGSDVIEIDLSGFSSPEGVLLDLPSSASVLAGLPAILAQHGMAFATDPVRYPTKRDLVVAYGSASAGRALLLSDSEIRAQARSVGDKAFAVAALLAEFVPGVRNRRAYFFGIIKKIQDGVEPVGLRRSWMRLARLCQPSGVIH